MGVKPPGEKGQPVPAKIPKPPKGAKGGPGELRERRPVTPPAVTASPLSYDEALQSFKGYAEEVLANFSGSHTIHINNQGEVDSITGIPENRSEALRNSLNAKLKEINQRLMKQGGTALIRGRDIVINIPA